METRVEVRDNITYAAVSGSINSSNAHEFEVALKDAPGDTNGVVIDANELEYLSSAGLRVLLSLKKRCKEKEFRIVGVNSEVMNIFDVTGFSEIMDIEPAIRKISVEGCEVIGKGACGECYRIDEETIIKLYYDNIAPEVIDREKALAKKAFVMGIPTAISYDIVEADGRKGVVYELIKSKTLGELIREDEEHLEQYVDMYVDICKQVNVIHTTDSQLPSFKEVNRQDIKKITGISEEEKEYLNQFIDLVPDDNACIHGDLNMNNIMVQNGECCLIDMGELSAGNTMFDLSRIAFSMVYANPEPGKMNTFYKMPSDKVSEIWQMFFKKYFGCESVEEAEKSHPEVKWLYPLAWFRCSTAMLKGNRWDEEYREKAKHLLRDELIPFVKENTK